MLWCLLILFLLYLYIYLYICLYICLYSIPSFLVESFQQGNEEYLKDILKLLEDSTEVIIHESKINRY